MELHFLGALGSATGMFISTLIEASTLYTRVSVAENFAMKGCAS